MSAHVKLTLLNSWGSRAFYRFLAMSLLNSTIQRMNVRFYLSHDNKITLKSHFWHENVKILPSFTQR